MKFRHLVLPLVVLVLAAAAPAHAAWTPLVPGWSVQEVPLDLAFVPTYQTGGMAIDPLSGDTFLVGAAAGAASLDLLRITPAGVVQHLAVLDQPYGPLVFDATHRVVLVRQNGQLTRFTELGAPLPPITGPPAPYPYAVGPDGELYAVAPGGQSATGLEVRRYDAALDTWAHVRDVAPAGPGSPLQLGTYPEPDQLEIDSAGRMFITVSGPVLFRLDDAVSPCLGSMLLANELAVGSGYAFLGAAYFDAGGAGAPPLAFATIPAGQLPGGVAAAPGGTVVCLKLESLPGGMAGNFALEYFTQSPTPAVQRSWGAVKALAR